MVKCMKMLGNSFREINLLQKKRLYRYCTLSIVLYSFPLWYYNKASIPHYLNILWKIQQRAALWISGTFHTSPTAGVKAILGLVPIHILLKKLYRRFLLRESTLSSNHIISSILSSNSSNIPNCHNLLIDLLTPKQRLCMKSALINMDNKCNELIPFFSFFNEKFRLGNFLIDSFSDRFSFHLHSSNINKHMKELDNTTFRALSNMSSAIVISDTSIKNHITTSISHIHLHNRPITKTIHRAVNISTTEAELFAIQCVSSLQMVDLVFFYFTFHFYFHSILFFYFLFLEQLGLEVIGHTVTSVTIWWHSHKTDYETWENLVEGSRTNDILQHGHHMLASWTIHSCLG